MADRSFPIFAVADLASVGRFYERLGFEQVYRFPPEGDPDFVALQRGEASLGLVRAGPSEGPSVSYWVYVDDVDASVAELRAAGAAVVEEPLDQPWGERVAAVLDPAGTRVHLGAPSADSAGG